jgi:hypothetical protein
MKLQTKIINGARYLAIVRYENEMQSMCTKIIYGFLPKSGFCREKCI